MATAVLSERDLECPICQDPFRTPKILPCGHSICLEPCLRRLLKGHGVQCPECRSQHDVPHGGVEYFPTNFFIQRIVDSTQFTTSQIDPGAEECPTCHTHTLLQQCLHCTQDICATCKHEHSQDLCTAAKNALDLLKESITPYSCPIDDLQHMMKTKAEKRSESLKCSIDDTFDILNAALVKRKNELKRDVDTRMFTRSDHVRALDMLADMVRDIYVFCGASVREDMTQSDFLTLLKDTQKRKDEMENCIESITLGDLQVSFDTELFELVKGFGEIKKEPKVQTCKSVKDLLHAALSVRKQPTAPPIEVRRLQENLTVSTQVRGMATSASGKIIVTQKGSKSCLEILDQTGDLLKVLQNPLMTDDMKYIIHYTDIAGGWATSNDPVLSVFVLDSANSKVHVYEESGSFLREYHTPGAKNVAMDAQNRLHICCGQAGILVADEYGMKIQAYCETDPVLGTEDFDTHCVAVDQHNRDDMSYVFTTDLSMGPSGNTDTTYNVFVFRSGELVYRKMEIDSLSGRSIDSGAISLAWNKFVITDSTQYKAEILVLDTEFKLLRKFVIRGGGLGRPIGTTWTSPTNLMVMRPDDNLQMFRV